jgi:hypothetical protein
MSNSTLTNKELLQRLAERLDNIEGHLPNGELKIILNHVETMMDKQSKMYDDLSDLKRILLNPENGVIVRVNKNTEYRLEQEQKETEIDRLIQETSELKTFKSNVTRALWIIFTAVFTSIAALWQQLLAK